MKKRLLFIIILFAAVLFYKTDVYAFDSSNYRNRGLCGAFEEVGMHSDGEMVTVGCFNTYEEAKADMVAKGNNDLVIMTTVNGHTEIIDANMALLDLSVNPDAITYFYTNQQLTGSSFTYMDNGSLYGGVDGVHMDTAYSSNANTWVAKVQIGNCEGWIPKQAYEIVPVTWIRSVNAYVVSDTDIRHIYVSKIQTLYTGNSGRTIGPKPDMLPVGTYYSFDGHYFYQNLETLIPDIKRGTRENSVNKNNPYYNYYMYLSNHTKTSYSSINIDEYIRNNMGYKENVYGTSASDGTSRLYGSGTFFYYAQQKYGVNAVLSLSLSRNETGNGRSYLAVNKNNGFGLNAVDSNPINGASWYASFSSSILGYASKWITYGYAHPRDWRYYGPQFGDKGSGMNVKYASDTFWSEKMAANYYSLDKAFGLQDYNYYQLGVVNGPTNAYLSPNTSSKIIYTYPEREDGVVIVGEENGFYKVMSDINIDSNGNEKSGDYNWHSYVYVKASDIRKINTGKNGYMDPNNVFEYEDSSYQYDLYIENTELKPKPAVTTKKSAYYYDSTLSSKTGKEVQNNRYVMVYTAAYKNGMPVAYLITSDYFHDQKHWVSADSIRFVSMCYGQENVSADNNQYSWVNSKMEDTSSTVISGLYTYTYVPLFEVHEVDGKTWYKVPVNLTGNDNVTGYTLAVAPGIGVTMTCYTAGDNKPVISAKDKTINEGETFDPKEGVTATDAEDGNLTDKIEIKENTVNTAVAGEYKVTYKVVDSNNNGVELTIKVTVKGNNAPVITATDKTLYVGDNFDPKSGVTATDTEDGDLTKNIKVTTNTVDTTKAGTYKVIYEVSDSKGKKTTKEIQVVVKETVIIDPEELELEELIEDSINGEFYLDEISWDNTNKKFTIQGYSILLNHDNPKDKEYNLLFVDKNNNNIYKSTISSWTDKVPYDLGTENGYSYSSSWFKGTITFSNIPNGDYDIYMMTVSKGDYTIAQVNNFLNRNISRRGEDSNHGYNFKVQQRTKGKELQLSIREKLYTTSEAPTSRNMVNGYDEIKFEGNNLYIYGYSYDYQGVYDKQSAITRKIIFENNSNYNQVVVDVGSTKGPFTLTTLDKKDKTYAWYEASIDISNLPKGEYTLYAYTKTSNAENYDEIPDMLKTLRKTATINGKQVTIYCNRQRNNRIELKVE